MKVINVTNILSDGRIDTTNTSRFISLQEFNKTYRHFAVNDRDIVVASSGNTYGKVGRISANDLPLMMNTSVIRFRSADRDRLDDNFLYAFLRSHLFRQQVEALVIGSAQPNFGPSHLKLMEMPLPPMCVQRCIAGVLAAHDDLLENNLHRIRILEDVARVLFNEWFVATRVPGLASAPGSQELPHGWGKKPLRDCVEINPKVVVPSEGEKPFVFMEALSNDSMIVGDVERRIGKSGSKFQNGDTLFARITPCLENGKTGFVQFLPEDQSVACGSTEFIVLRSKTLTPEFVYLLARTDEFRGTAIKSMSGASGRQRVQERCFDTMSVVQPPAEVLARFTEVVRPMFRLVHQLHLQNLNVRATRDLLLPRLLSGQLSLTIIEGDPAPIAEASAALD
jgi:type I restriction enzyme, S subunit